MTEKAPAPARGRLHRATYARDKKKGGYLIRVAGPAAASFAGREVPVTMQSGEEHMEKLVALLWSGIDDGERGGVAGQPVALYTFESRPRTDEDVLEF